ncbi:MAG: hypothetical protein AAB116_20880 [Candidatus Poribacteria bacterium]
MKNKWFALVIFVVLALFALNNLASALTYDFVGKDAKKWFDEFTAGKDSTKGGGDAGWKLVTEGLTTDDNVGTGHQRVGIASTTWTDYTVEAKFQFLKFGDWNESHIYLRWQNEANNYYIRTIKRNNAGDKNFWSIEWLRKVASADNEGDVTDDVKIITALKEKTIYGLRGKIAGQVVNVDFFNGSWLTAGSVTYPGTFTKGGVGVARSSSQVAWQYISINGAGIPADGTQVESLGKLSTTWGGLKEGN